MVGGLSSALCSCYLLSENPDRPPQPPGDEVHALDLGCGSGALAMMAARAGAMSVVAVDAHETLCTIARKNVALNGLGSKVGCRGGGQGG